MAKPRRATTETVYRQRLWRRVARALQRTTKAEIARRWLDENGKQRSKSALTRLETTDLPTTLGTLDGLAAALDMSLGELLWPLVNPKDPQGAEQTAEESYSNAEVQDFQHKVDELRDVYAMDLNDANKLVRVVARLAMASPKTLPAAIDVVEGLMLLREKENRHE